MEGKITISEAEVRAMVEVWVKDNILKYCEDVHIDSIESPHYTGLEIKVCFSNKPKSEMAAE